MEYRLATSEDLPALERLSGDVFGDDARFVKRSFRVLAGPGQVYVAQQAGRVMAQLYAVPCHVGAVPGIYLFALATRPENRGGGVMSGLMQYAEAAEAAKGARFAALIPANEPLYAYYDKRGYTQKIYLRHLEKQQGDAFTADMRNAKFSPEEFAARRSRYAAAVCVGFAPNRYKMILEDLYEEGFLCAETDEAYAVYKEREKDLLVAELFAESDAAAGALLGALGRQTGRGTARLTLADAAGPYAGQGVARPAALAKALDKKFDDKKLYLRFGFDEIKE